MDCKTKCAVSYDLQRLIAKLDRLFNKKYLKIHENAILGV